jgi:heme exporter protein A
MTDWVIDAKHLRKTFAWTPVLQDISCQIGPGAIVSIFGPNGAGKTTFLRILATLLQPSAGALRLFGQPPTDAAVRRRLGFLGHESFLYPDLTAEENLTFYGHAYQVENTPARIDAILKEVGLHQWRKTPVRIFSRGMEQRLSLARALLHDPELLLFDEPYTGLDTRGVKTLQTVLTTAKERGKTVVLTTHDFTLGLEVSSRALILQRGRIIWESEGRVPPTQEFIELYHDQTQSSGSQALGPRP